MIFMTRIPARVTVKFIELTLKEIEPSTLFQIYIIDTHTQLYSKKYQFRLI